MKKYLTLLLLTIFSSAAMAQDSKEMANGLGNRKSHKSRVVNKEQGKSDYSSGYKSTSNSTSSKNSIKEMDEIWHITYINSLKDGDDGLYGFGGDSFNGNGGLGMSMRMMTNAFIANSDDFIIKASLGPNYSCPVNNLGRIVFPVMVGTFGYTKHDIDYDTGKDDKKTKLGFCIEAMPLIALGRNAGVSIGPYCIYSFVTKKTNWGGHISIWF